MKDVKQAFELIQFYTEVGDITAQYNLAMMYAEGNGTIA
jgi:TPR repeat protein